MSAVSMQRSRIFVQVAQTLNFAEQYFLLASLPGFYILPVWLGFFGGARPR